MPSSPEHFPYYERPEPVVVGSSSESEKEAFLNTIRARFGERHREFLSERLKSAIERGESMKRPYEKLAINLSNKYTNSLLRKFGLPSFDIPSANIHFLTDEAFKEALGENTDEVIALTSYRNQAILINRSGMRHPFDSVEAILHEMIHMKNFLSFWAKDGRFKNRRFGLMSFSLEQSGLTPEKVAFNSLNEAVVAELTKRGTFLIIEGNPFLEKELSFQRSPEVQRLKKLLAKKNGIDEDEILWVDSEAKKSRVFSHLNERKFLNYLVDEIFKDNQGKFSDREGVMNLFFKAHFDGRLLTLARLIEKSFGKGAFRKISSIDLAQEQSLADVWQSLKSQRHQKSG